eukprot:TRINITY_DN61185_c0_g1_i1.p1 TRINITY_DN61185_c0_g1~~TRINITY_DN61185_c0_g1_i1.p1  ORF type:complete len:1786 (+),score=270.97 TRINITY_DN61185_c0_g1_i1:62-5359(+)
MLGDSVRRAERLAAAAEPGATLVDEVTATRCQGELETSWRVEPLDDNPRESMCATDLRSDSNTSMRRGVYLVNALGKGSHRSGSERSGSKDSDRSPSGLLPWLKDSMKYRESLIWEPSTHQYRTHISAERPPPIVPRRLLFRTHSRDIRTGTGDRIPEVGHGASFGDLSSVPVITSPCADSLVLPGASNNESVTPWKTHIKVRLPWTPHCVACGGVSPLPRLRTWRDLIDAEVAVDTAIAEGGGTVVFTGPAGCGKTEILEHLVCRSITRSKMQPVFVAMQMRECQRWTPMTSVLRGLLTLLEPSGELNSDEEFKTRLAEEASSPEEMRALEFAGLSLSARSPRETPCSRSRSTPGVDQLTLSNHWHCDVSKNDECDGADASDDGEWSASSALVDIATRLAERLLEQGDVVLCFRIAQGTSLLPVDTSLFWDIVSALGCLAGWWKTKCHSMLVLVSCQQEHWNMADVPSECQPVVVQIDPLREIEIHRYVSLCLGFVSPSSPCHVADESKIIDEDGLMQVTASSEGFKSRRDAAVPPALLSWLCRRAVRPGDIEEALTQLVRDGVIEVTMCRCLLLCDLSSVRVSSWVQTRMVGRILSKLELMDPEMLHVLQAATVLDGPLSALDLAAANRAHTLVCDELPRMVLALHYAKRLVACQRLVRAGFLERVDWLQHSMLEQPWQPLWKVSSVVIREVVSTTFHSGSWIKMKRAILMSRIMYLLRDNKPAWQGDVDEGYQAADQAVRRRRELGLDKNSFWNRSSTLLVHPWSADTDTSFSHHRTDRLSASVPSERPAFKFCLSALPASCIVVPKALHVYISEGNIEEDKEDEACSEDAESLVGARSMFSQIRRRGSLLDIATAHQQVIAHRLGAIFNRVRQVLQCIVVLAITMVLFGPDFLLFVGTSREAVNASLWSAFVFLSLFSVASMLVEPGYCCTHLVCCDMIILICAVLDIAGKSSGLNIQRKNAGSIWRLFASWVKFGACCLRFYWLIQNLVSRRSCMIFFDRIIRPLRPKVVDSDGSDALSSISRQLAKAILGHVSMFTVMTILSLNIVDVFTPPVQDLSMESWAERLRLSLTDGEWANASSTALDVDLADLEAFYKDGLYGPYRICKGRGDSSICEGTVLWESDGEEFSAPSEDGFLLHVNSVGDGQRIEASFDFSRAVKSEAGVRIVIVAAAVLAMLGSAWSLDHLLARFIVKPLLRLLTTVRQVSEQLERLFPLVELPRSSAIACDRVDEDDEVTAFEKNVTKVSLMINLMNKSLARECTGGSEWIDGAAQATAQAEAQETTETSREPGRLETGPLKDDFQNAQNEDVHMGFVEALEAIGIRHSDMESWSFDVLKYELPKLTAVAGWLLTSTASSSVVAKGEVISTFLEIISQEYFDIPYHSWRHAVDVTYVVSQQLLRTRASEYIPSIDAYALLVAAIGHDVGHPGFNNIFLVQTHHEFALRYNDVSPLENMHCSTMFGVFANNPKANVFSALKKEQFREARRVCIDTILSTDNAHHFEMVKEMQVFYTTNFDHQEGVDFPSEFELEVLQQPNSRRLTLNILLHGADLSNPCKPWEICKSWAELVIGEFFRQGDREKALGIPVQMLNNRATLNKPSSQVAFIQFMIAPFISAHVKLFPPLWELASTVASNLERWHRIHAEGTGKAAEEQENHHQVCSTGETLRGIVASARQRSTRREHGSRRKSGSSQRNKEEGKRMSKSSPQSKRSRQVSDPLSIAIPNAAEAPGRNQSSGLISPSSSFGDELSDDAAHPLGVQHSN